MFAFRSLVYSLSFLLGFSGLTLYLGPPTACPDGVAGPVQCHCYGNGEDLKENPIIEALKRAAVTVKSSGGTGSGALVVRGDYTFVLTAGHVVEDNRKEEEAGPGKKKEIRWSPITVYQKEVADGEVVGEHRLEADVIRYSNASSGQDLAVLLVRKKKAFEKGVTFYENKKIPPIGTELLHVGSPFGDFGAQSVIPGFYSAHGRTITGSTFDQITCSTFPGSSGGMVTLKSDGRYVGMVLRGAQGGFILVRPFREIKSWAIKEKAEWIVDPRAQLPKDEDLKKYQSTEDK